MIKNQPVRRQNPLPVPESNALLVYEESAFPQAADGETKITAHAVLRHIALNQGINSPRLAEFFKKTMKTISRFTTELRYRDFIEFRGSLCKGGYFLKSKGLVFLKNPDSLDDFSPQRMTSERVLAFLREHPGTNHYGIAAHFQRSIKSATRHTYRLRKEQKIVFRGTPRDGGFYVVDES